MLDNYKIILWDFDGVIMDSMPVRSKGFAEVLKQYPAHEVQKLLNFHHTNGGLSRYYKFRYFFEQIRGESITDEKVLELAEQFSTIMLSLLQDKKLLIADTVEYIIKHANKYTMHVVSGSDQTELRTICKAVGLDGYFKLIHGSPTPKNELVRQVIEFNNYNREDVIMIGDSINDYEAAHKNGIDFAGYNNAEVATLSERYINSFAGI